METYRKGILMLLFAVVLPMVVSAQEVIVKDMLANGDQLSSVEQQKVPLYKELQKAQHKYGIKIFYMSNDVNGKYVIPAGNEVEPVDIEATLTNMLSHFNLKLQKLAENSYVVMEKDVPRKLEKLQKLAENSNVMMEKDATNKLEIVTGTVHDQGSNEVLPAVNVLVKGTTIGTSTNSEGRYELNVPSLQDTLVFSFVGFQSQQVPINGRTEINVTLQPVAITGDELVVVGYGKVKKSNITGAITDINSEEFERVPTLDPLQALQGRIPGLQIEPSSGSPGAGSNILIRGTQSIRGTNEPIFVVDGTISESIDDIDPQDMESVSVLKDASSTAIYGARAANGVILVTTKRGNQDQTPTITFKTEQSFEHEGNSRINYLNAEQWLEINTEAWENSGESVPWTNEDLSQYENVDVDWSDIVKQTGSLSNYDLSVAGGGGSSNYFISTSYSDHKGIIKGERYDRLNLRINTDHDIWDNRISIGNSLNIFSSDVTRSREYDGRDAYSAAFRYTPLNRAYTEDGDFATINNVHLEGKSPSPLWMFENSDVNNNRKGLNGNMYLSILVADGLEFTTRGSFNWSRDYIDNFIGAMAPHYQMEGANVNEVEKESIERQHWISDFLLEYDTDFNNNHSFNSLLGYSLEEQTEEDLRGIRGGTPNNNIRFLDAGDPNVSRNGNSFEDWAFESMFARVGYSFKNKYIFSGTVRRDGTSRLTKENRYGVFPSLSAAWRVTEERFLSSIDWLDELKVRASWGVVGNILAVGEYDTDKALRQWNYVFNQEPTIGYTSADAVNTDLKWEQTSKKNVGVDLDLFDERLYLVSDFFIEDTDDLLFLQPIPSSAGLAGRPLINAGHIRNTGVDLILGHRNNIREWTYDFNVNFSHVKNEVIDLDGRDLTTSGIKEGHPVGSFFGYKSNGLIRTQEDLDNHPHLSGKQIGDIWLMDINGFDDDGELTGEPDGKIDGADRTLIEVNPDFRYGLSGSVSFKNVTFQLHLEGMMGGDKYMRRGGFVMDMFTAEPNMEADYILDRYHPEKNPDGKYPRVSIGDRGNNTLGSDFWLIDASYLSIRNVNINYSLANEISSKIGVSDLSIYLSVQNLYRFGNEYAQINSITSVPITRRASLGLKLTF